MTTRIVKSEYDRDLLLKLLKEAVVPFTVDIVHGKRRSVEQNRLNRLWMNEVAEQLDDRTAEDVRAFCKLTMAVPILRAESEHFRKHYDEVLKPLTYEKKLAIMAEPLDLPCTRLMTVGQKSRYLDEVYRYFTEKGVELTRPDDMGRAA